MLRELRQKRAGLVAQARSILDTAEAEKRALTQEEENQYNVLMDEVNKLGQDIQRREQIESVEHELSQQATSPIREDEEGGEGENRALHGRESDEYRGAFRNYLRGGLNALHGEEVRALQSDNDALGGYLVAPMQFVRDIIRAVDNAVYIRQWATTFQVPNAQSLGAPSLESDPSDPTWTSELKTGSEDSTMEFGKRELTPKPLAKRIKVSRKLLRQVPDVESFVIGRLGYKFGVAAENAYLNGSGANQPLGVFTASAEGISTSRDVSTGNTATEIKFDNLINVKYALKQQYWPRAKWLFHRDAVKMIAKIKDGDGQYIWRESVRAGEPDRLLNIPVFMSEYAPNTFTTQLYVGILGDFSHYWIADALDMQVQMLFELYAETNQVGMIGRMESDGQPVLEEAFVRVKLA